jgi:hypothetical protein
MKWASQIANEGIFYIPRFAHWPILITKMRGAASSSVFAVEFGLGRNGLP